MRAHQVVEAKLAVEAATLELRVAEQARQQNAEGMSQQQVARFAIIR